MFDAALSVRNVRRAVCLAGLFASVAQPVAAQIKRVTPGMVHEGPTLQWTKASSVLVTGDPGGTVSVSLRFSRPVAYTYTAATGVLSEGATPPAGPSNPRGSATASVENTNPIAGIGVVVKKNPGGSAERLVQGPGDTGAALPDWGDGEYQLVVHLSTQRGSAGERLIFTLQRTGGNFTVTSAQHAINTKGTGCSRSPTQPNTVTPINPRDPNCSLKTRTKSNSTNE